ncbi:hypothetical protein ARMSODRAFT_970047 [Armillaria solidipes]|uniref:Uncharacterized protein n=1 Tax=Armillaria solidipes TaxID=1076256 RepID=A0A2H3BX21_9AGAR|nr:hypothetical protein ARMSODRAFT_970047 [Armillaria solidipes]
MTSKPVLESKNQYAALSIESMNNDDNDLHPQDDRHDTGDAVAAKRNDLKSKTLSPLLLGPVQENLKGPSQSPARAQAKAVNPTGHGAESPIDKDDGSDDTELAAPSPGGTFDQANLLNNDATKSAKEEKRTH